MADAARITGSLDDFSRAGTELTFLSWLTLTEARKLDLPFITEIVLSEVDTRLANPTAGNRPAPFLYHAEGRSFVDAL